MHLIGRDQQCATAFGKFERDVHLLQRTDYGATVTVRQIGVEHPVIRALAPEPAADDERYHGRNRNHDAEFLLQRNQAERLNAGCRGKRGVYRHR